MKWGPQLFDDARRVARGGRPRPAAAVVVRFESEPSGARVVVGPQVLGETPLVIDNDFPDGPIPVRFEKPGYRAWTGTFEGGKPVAVTAVMRR